MRPIVWLAVPLELGERWMRQPGGIHLSTHAPYRLIHLRLRPALRTLARVIMSLSPDVFRALVSHFYVLTRTRLVPSHQRLGQPHTLAFVFDLL